MIGNKQTNRQQTRHTDTQTNRQQARQRRQTDKQALCSGDERWEKDSNWEVIGYNQKNRKQDTLTKRQKDTPTNRRKKNINKMAEGREQICGKNLE